MRASDFAQTQLRLFQYDGSTWVVPLKSAVEVLTDKDGLLALQGFFKGCTLNPNLETHHLHLDFPPGAHEWVTEGYTFFLGKRLVKTSKATRRGKGKATLEDKEVRHPSPPPSHGQPFALIQPLHAIADMQKSNGAKRKRTSAETKQPTPPEKKQRCDPTSDDPKEAAQALECLSQSK